MWHSWFFGVAAPLCKGPESWRGPCAAYRWTEFDEMTSTMRRKSWRWEPDKGDILKYDKNNFGLGFTLLEPFANGLQHGKAQLNAF
jgi:hypothetical protein